MEWLLGHVSMLGKQEGERPLLSVTHSVLEAVYMNLNTSLILACLLSLKPIPKNQPSEPF